MMLQKNTKSNYKSTYRLTDNDVYVLLVVITILFITIDRVCKKNNMTVATSKAGTAYPSGIP